MPGRSYLINAMRKPKNPGRLGDLPALKHRERMGLLMRDLKTPYALWAARMIIEQTERELKEAEEGLAIALSRKQTENERAS